MGDIDHIARKAEADHDCGDYAAHKEFADGRTSQHGENDHLNAGREDGANDCRGCRKGAGEGHIVAVLTHFFDLHEAAAGCIRNSGAAHAGKNQGDDDIHISGSASDLAKNSFCKGVHIIGDLT